MDKKNIISIVWLVGLLTFIATIAIITAPDKLNRLEFIEEKIKDIQEQRTVLTEKEKKLEKLATEKDWEEVDNDNSK